MKLGEYVKNQFCHDDVGAIIVYGSQDEKDLDALVEHFSQPKFQSFVHEISPINILHENYQQFQKGEEGYYFLDCETDGLYGSFLSAAILAVDGNQKVERVSYLYHLPETVTNDFAKKTVLPKLEGYEETIRKTLDLDATIEISICKVKDEKELVTEAGKILSENLDRKIYAEHLFPVEYRFTKELKISLERLVEIGLPIKPVATSSDSEKDVGENLEKENYLTQHKKPNYQHTAWYDAYESMKSYLSPNPISSHVFILPFKLKNFKNIIQNSQGGWTECEYKDKFLDIPYEVGEKKNGYDKALHHNFEMYFNSEMKDLLKDESHTEHYCYKPDKKLYYHIDFAKGENNSLTYTLPVNYILLRIVKSKKEDDNYGQLGFLILSLDNYNYHDEETIVKLNQYGRRIYDPFMTGDGVSTESAQNLRLTEDENSSSSEAVIGKEVKTAISELLISAFGKDAQIFSDSPNKDQVSIEKIIDDRMFVMSHYASDSINQLLKNYAEASREDSKLSVNDKTNTYKDIYKYIYIDNGYSTCQSKRMLEELLPKSLYKRWIDDGTAYGITQHSMIMLTSKTAPSYLLAYFYTEYLEMILWVLTQRVGILRYSALAGKQSETGQANELLQLQKSYVRFKNQYLLPELTPQEQGVELYDVMQDNLYISKQKLILDEQIESLYEIGQTEQNQRLNIFVLLLSCLTVITAFSDFSGSLGEISKDSLVTCILTLKDNQAIHHALIGAAIILLILGFICYKRYRRVKCSILIICLLLLLSLFLKSGLLFYIFVILFLAGLVFGLTPSKIVEVIKSSRF